MKPKPIANVVMEYFRVVEHEAGTVNDILSFFVEQFGKDNAVEVKKARHAIYLKASRLVNSGELEVREKRGNVVVYGLPSGTSSKSSTENARGAVSEDSDDKELLLKREAELKYELKLCIAEAKGYEQMKAILPKQGSLLDAKKEAARERAIQLNGLLTSTQNIMSELYS